MSELLSLFTRLVYFMKQNKGDGNFHALIMLDKTNPEHVDEANRLSSFMVHKVCVRFPVSPLVGRLRDSVFHV